MSKFPAPVTLYPSRRKWVLLLLAGIIFTAGGIGMIHSGQSSGWLPAGFFGLGTIVAIATMLPGAARLTLDRDGFEARAFFRSNRIRWADTAGFVSSRIPPARQHFVVYDYLPQQDGALASVNKAIAGRNAGLGDTYGLSADDLARLMTQWRERALTAGAGSAAGAPPRP